LEAIKLAEQNRFPEAMKLFGDAIALAPTMASLYNDRAQVIIKNIFLDYNATLYRLKDDCCYNFS